MSDAKLEKPEVPEGFEQFFKQEGVIVQCGHRDAHFTIPLIVNVGAVSLQLCNNCAIRVKEAVFGEILVIATANAIRSDKKFSRLVHKILKSVHKKGGAEL